MTSMENRPNLIVLAVGVVVAAVTFYMLMNRRSWSGRHLPTHPASPRPGTVPRMARGLRSSVR